MVEIKGKVGRIERVYFHIDPARRRQWETQHLQESKERFLNTVERENPKIKQNEFVDFCENMIYEMRYSALLLREPKAGAKAKFSIAALTARYQHLARWSAFMLTAVLNILLLTFTTNDEEVQETSPTVGTLISVLSVLHTCVSVVLLASFFTLKLPMILFKQEKEISRNIMESAYLRGDEDSLGDVLTLEGLRNRWDRLVIGSSQFPKYFHNRSARNEALEHALADGVENAAQILGFEEGEGEKRPVGWAWSFLRRFAHDSVILYHTWVLGVVVLDVSFLYSLGYLVLSVLGTLVNPFFFGIHILDIALQNPILQSVLQSVTHNGRQLFFTLTFTACVVYIYTLFAFNFFQGFYVEDDNKRWGWNSIKGIV